MEQVKYSDANDMINNKIARNNIAADIYDIQKKISETDIAIKKIHITIYDAKSKIIQNMNKIEQLQLNNYEKEREETINQQISELDNIENTWTEQLTLLFSRIENLYNAYEEKTNMFNEVSKKIPTCGVVTNYTRKITN